MGGENILQRIGRLAGRKNSAANRKTSKQEKLDAEFQSERKG